jgi:List-Bact-rpt repeat protein
MNRKWLAVAALIIAAISLLSVASCGDPQTLQSITVQPSTVTIGASNIPVSANTGIQVQMRALGSYLHPPVTKDITDQVTWASNTPQMFTINSTGLMTTTGLLCGGALISASLTTNSDGSGVSSSGAIVTGNMTASVVCFTSSGSGGGSSEPILTVNFQGSGTGVVASSTSGFSCASTAVSCVDSFPSGTTVTLNATPVSPSTFGGWSGGCTGTGACTILMETDTTVTATFN